MDQFISHDIFAEPETSSNKDFIESCDRFLSQFTRRSIAADFTMRSVIFIPNQVGKTMTSESHQVTWTSPLMLDIWRNRKRNTTWTWQSTLPSAVGLACWVWVLSRVFFVFKNARAAENCWTPWIPIDSLIPMHFCFEDVFRSLCSLFFPKWDMRSKLVHSERQQIIHGFPKCCPLCSMRFLFGRPERRCFLQEIQLAIFCQLVVRNPLHGSS